MLETNGRLAIIIVSWNVRHHLVRCLESLERTLAQDRVDATVWVVDNASADGTAGMVRESHPWVHLEPLDENLGFVGAINLALDHLRGQASAYWLLNPDTIVHPGTGVSLFSFLAAHPRAGMVSPKLLNSDGSLQECAFHFPGLAQALFALGWMPDRLYYTRLNGRYPPHRFDQDAPFKIDHPLGAAMMARAEAIEDVGPLDPAFFMYCEEIDWSWRMRKAGWDSWLLPAAEVTHVGGASSGQARPETTRYLWESRARLYKRYRGALTLALVRAVVLRTFAAKHRHADSRSWADCYEAILRAWQ
jgi:N-acetylglucosaminyl-diphospho-decaprenol L-rhamnosyltransferase